jgi:hypothetical protein
MFNLLLPIPKKGQSLATTVELYPQVDLIRMTPFERLYSTRQKRREP